MNSIFTNSLLTCPPARLPTPEGEERGNCSPVLVLTKNALIFYKNAMQNLLFTRKWCFRAAARIWPLRENTKKSTVSPFPLLGRVLSPRTPALAFRCKCVPGEGRGDGFLPKSIQPVSSYRKRSFHQPDQKLPDRLCCLLPGGLLTVAFQRAQRHVSQ